MLEHSLTDYPTGFSTPFSGTIVIMTGVCSLIGTQREHALLADLAEACEQGDQEMFSEKLFQCKFSPLQRRKLSARLPSYLQLAAMAEIQ